MKTTDILTRGCVCVPLAATDKEGAITELIDALDREGLLTARDQVLGAVLARERIRSTATEGGLAVPHGKSPGVKKLVMAVGKPKSPLDFAAPEGYPPCELIILLASAIDETGPHIQALAKVSRIWLNHDFRKAIQAATTKEAVYAAFEKFEG